MRERLTGYDPEDAQAQRPFDSEIARFCGGLTSRSTMLAYAGDLRAFSNFAVGVGVRGLNQLTSELIHSYLEHCEASGLSKASVRRRTASRRPDLSPRVLRQTFIANVPTNDPKELADLLGVGENHSVELLRRRRLTQQLPQSEVLFEATTK